MSQLTDERLPSRARPMRGKDAAKRALDLLVASAALLVLGPVLAVLACLVWLTSPGPALFRQQRLGRGERPFTILKLRTMTANNDDRIHRDYVTSLLADEQEGGTKSGGLYKLDADPRITAVGGWLRTSSLDELPQLLNVLRGDMSVVGPRPVLAWEAEMFHDADRERFQVKPGITGLWQVSGRNRLSFREALALDVEYVRRRSLALDVLIILRTGPALIRYRAR